MMMMMMMLISTTMIMMMYGDGDDDRYQGHQRFIEPHELQRYRHHHRIITHQ